VVPPDEAARQQRCLVAGVRLLHEPRGGGRRCVSSCGRSFVGPGASLPPCFARLAPRARSWRGRPWAWWSSRRRLARLDAVECLLARVVRTMASLEMSSRCARTQRHARRVRADGHVGLLEPTAAAAFSVQQRSASCFTCTPSTSVALTSEAASCAGSRASSARASPSGVGAPSPPPPLACTSSAHEELAHAGTPCGAACGAAVVVLWWCCGGAVVVLWWCCGGAVVVLWCCCSAAAPETRLVSSRLEHPRGSLRALPAGARALCSRSCTAVEPLAWQGHGTTPASRRMRPLKHSSAVLPSVLPPAATCCHLP
jgi:hypothetical protein